MGYSDPVLGTFQQQLYEAQMQQAQMNAQVNNTVNAIGYSAGSIASLINSFSR